ncbi:MAG: hypothetical protein A2283_21240 [Lentisphaerae bacterium RIFOXYA12_FULL_48_11]|nr:MAG: hypothetical protein A2283_21240 [Lentisphaerae bacterium RIFOXYA12_FULL_48_11]
MTGFADEPTLNLAVRRELFIDRYLIESMPGLELRQHAPSDEGEVLRFNQPWEGMFCTYSTIIKDSEKYHLYYRGKDGGSDGKGEVTCYAESGDGLVWNRPKLGLYEVAGSKDNNIILTGTGVTHNFSPFLDTRPGVPRAERFKALGGLLDKNATGGLHALASEDGIHWHDMYNKPVITRGAFDSQNVCFWSELEQRYVCFLRVFTKGTTTSKEWTPSGLRSVARTDSTDFEHWTEPGSMQFQPAQDCHLYTSQTHPYFRAPHIYIATAARFMPGRHGITDEDAKRLQVSPSYYKAAKDVSDSVLLTSRDGRIYNQTFREAFIRPGLRLSEWVSRCGYPALNVVQTGPAEMSIYVNQDYAQPTAHLRRYSMRLDGFASLRAPYDGGEMITKPLTFQGRRLMLNFSTSAAGGIRVEIQDASGKPLPGFTLTECVEIFGNEIERTVQWKGDSDVSRLAGQIVRLRFVMKDADLFALCFTKDSK